MNVEEAPRNSDNESKNNNRNENEDENGDGQENDGDEEDIELDINVDTVYDAYGIENKENERFANFDPSNFESDTIEDKLYNPNVSQYENEKIREMSFKMLDSWNDRLYSHLRTFRNYSPLFSNKDKLYDHSTRKMVFKNDELFTVKDVVVHVSKRNYNNPNNYIRLRFNADNITESNGTFDFFYKLTIMKNEIGGIWKKIKRSDFVAQR